MRGVDVDQFFAVQQELDETRETGSLGYRGLVGPPSRRPSTIVARLVGRMMRKSLPTATSSFERPPSVLDTRTSDLVPAGQESGLVTPTNQVLMTLPVADSRKTSPASSRRSSLRRQECIDVDEDEHEAISSQSVSEDDFEDDEKPVNKQCMVSGGSFVPTVYVTPPPSTVFTPSDSSSGHEVINHFQFFHLLFKRHVFLGVLLTIDT